MPLIRKHDKQRQQIKEYADRGGESNQTTMT